MSRCINTIHICWFLLVLGVFASTQTNKLSGVIRLEECAALYPSATLALDVARSEYENEINRSSILDSKTNTVISLGAVLFVAIAQIIDIKKILAFQITKFADAILPSFMFITIVCSIIFIFIALILFLRVIFTQPYAKIDSNYLYDIEKWKVAIDRSAIATSYLYIQATIFNRSINDKRVSQYRKGVICLVTSVAFFVIYSVLTSTF